MKYVYITWIGLINELIAKTQSLVCIDPSNKSSTACFVKISPSPNFLIIVYEVVLHNFITAMNKYLS